MKTIYDIARKFVAKKKLNEKDSVALYDGAVAKLLAKHRAELAEIARDFDMSKGLSNYLGIDGETWSLKR